MGLNYSKVSLQKNGAVTNLVGYKSIDISSIPFRRPIQQQGGYQLPTSFDPPNPVDNGGLLNINIKRDVIDPINAEISGAIQLHQIDITVAVVGILLIVVAVAAIAKPL